MFIVQLPNGSGDNWNNVACCDHNLTLDTVLLAVVLAGHEVFPLMFLPAISGMK